MRMYRGFMFAAFSVLACVAMPLALVFMYMVTQTDDLLMQIKYGQYITQDILLVLLSVHFMDKFRGSDDG